MILRREREREKGDNVVSAVFLAVSSFWAKSGLFLLPASVEDVDRFFLLCANEDGLFLVCAREVDG